MRARSPRSDMSPLNYYPNYSTNYIMLANKRIPATTILYQPCFSATQIDLVLSSCHLGAKRPPSLSLSLLLLLLARLHAYARPAAQSLSPRAPHFAIVRREVEKPATMRSIFRVSVTLRSLGLGYGFS